MLYVVFLHGKTVGVTKTKAGAEFLARKYREKHGWSVEIVGYRVKSRC